MRIVAIPATLTLAALTLATLTLATLTLTLAAPAQARDMLFWNQTVHEFNSVRLAAPGSNAWGEEQAHNDTDHAVSADERLRIVGIAPGTYDLRLVDTHGAACVLRNIEVKGTGRVAFAVDEDQWGHCGK